MRDRKEKKVSCDWFKLQEDFWHCLSDSCITGDRVINVSGPSVAAKLFFLRTLSN